MTEPRDKTDDQPGPKPDLEADVIRDLDVSDETSEADDVRGGLCQHHSKPV